MSHISYVLKAFIYVTFQILLIARLTVIVAFEARAEFVGKKKKKRKEKKKEKEKKELHVGGIYVLY